MMLLRAGKEAKPDQATDETPAPRKGHNNLVPAIVLAMGLLGGGFFMGNRSAPAQVEAAPPATAGHVTEDPGHGPIQDLEPITLNLADGHFLKVGLALQLAETDGGGGHGAGSVEVPSAKALDLAIGLLGTHTMAELSDPESRDKAKGALSELVAEAYTDPETHQPMVTKVYFTEFVMQ